MPEKLEERVALLEAEVARLKDKVESDSFSKPWWEQIADNPAYNEAMQLAREYRDSLRSNSIEQSED